MSILAPYRGEHRAELIRKFCICDLMPEDYDRGNGKPCDTDDGDGGMWIGCAGMTQAWCAGVMDKDSDPAKEKEVLTIIDKFRENIENGVERWWDFKEANDSLRSRYD